MTKRSIGPGRALPAKPARKKQPPVKRPALWQIYDYVLSDARWRVIRKFIVAVEAPGGAALGMVEIQGGLTDEYCDARRGVTPDELALEVALSGVRHLQGKYQIYVSSPSTTLVRGARGRGPRTGNPALWAELDLWSRRHHIEFIWCPVGRVMDEARALAYRAIDLFQEELAQEAPEKS